MTLVAWLSAFVFNVVVLVVPLTVGRRAFSALGVSLSHDLYACFLGGYLLWGAAAAARVAASAVRGADEHGPGLRLGATDGFARLCNTFLRGASLGIWLAPIPVLIGSLIDSIFILPLREDASPLVLYQCWAMGACRYLWCPIMLTVPLSHPSCVKHRIRALC